MMKRQPVLKNLKKERGLGLISLSVSIASFLVIAFVLPAFAKAVSPKNPPLKNQQQIRYDVYAGGIHALQADLNINLAKKNRYSLVLSAKTYGLLGKLAPWHGTFETHGWSGKKNQPEFHQSSATWRDELEVKKYSYNKDGSFKDYRIRDDENDGSPKDVDDELTQGTSDVLTATLNTMQIIAAGKECSGSTEVFDGERRFKMIFNKKRDVVLDASRWNAYAGPAMECTVEVQPAAGKWHKKPRGWMSIQEQGRERGTMPTIWFARIGENDPAIPVKVRVKTSYGTLFMHMTEYLTDSQKLVLED